jgi:hypothetical protein
MMRHISLAAALPQIFADEAGKKALQRLRRAHLRLVGLTPANRITYTGTYGSDKWKPVKDMLICSLGSKCWYTEVELTGAPLAVDHYRPISVYWWLTFDPDNFRIACAWANSPRHNSLYGRAGGKGSTFPLLPPELIAKGKARLRVERPILLDPCNVDDCALLAFQADGRPILNPNYSGNMTASQRVEQSKIVLNLDHPDFNSKREQLCQQIIADVRAHEALRHDPTLQAQIRAGIQRKLAASAPFSTAARFYLQFHRHLDWVQGILDSD